MCGEGSSLPDYIQPFVGLTMASCTICRTECWQLQDHIRIYLPIGQHLNYKEWVSKDAVAPDYICVWVFSALGCSFISFLHE